MKTSLVLWAVLAATPAFATGKARNVILFLGDAGGIPTLHAASLYGHNDPQALFLQHLPHLALSDTSSADRWVTDSAAGMSAIVTGQKTNNGVLSESAEAVPRKSEGRPLQTILEYAEQHGLATGVITNMSIADATPAACYAHANYRKSTGEIFAQLAHPRFGDGVDVAIGAGRKEVWNATRALGIDIDAALHAQGYLVLDDPAQIPDSANRVVAVTDHSFDPLPAVHQAIQALARNPSGYFLMVEWDMHTDHIKPGLDHVLQMDALIKQTASEVGEDTLLLFTADHSFDLRVRGGKRGEPLLPAVPAAEPAESTTTRTENPFTGEQVAESKLRSGATKVAAMNVRMENGHTGEQVLVAAQGPGAERVHGFIHNTDIFHIMMAAYGWETP